MALFAWEICVILALFTNYVQSCPVAQVSSGQVKGSFLESRQYGRKFCAFRGIPYAQPPIGQLRFERPVPVEPWSGIFDASNDSTECPQFNYITNNVDGTEDCLVINVYTHQLPSADNMTKLPVLVFIHGGGFLIGAGGSHVYGPSRYMDHDIVLVTLNYRLGVLGFLSTGDEHIPGNYALHDQVLALKWVQENIANFGGDPEKVTISGESAGAASVIYLMLSPAAKGLFHAAIAQSGTALNKWAVQKEPLFWAERLANKVLCSTEDHKEMTLCLKNVPINDLILETKNLGNGIPYERAVQPVFLPLYMQPVVETNKDNKSFISECPHVLAQEGRIASKVPLIIGVNRHEGYPFYVDNNAGIANPYGHEYLYNDLAKILSTRWHSDLELSRDIINKIEKEYFGQQDLNNQSNFKEAIIKIMGDDMFVFEIQKTIELFSKAGIPMYTYHYNHGGKHSFAELFGASAGGYAGHADELFVLFDFYYAQSDTVDPKDVSMGFIMTKLWSDFVRTRKPSLIGTNVENPSIEWNLYDADNPTYLDLSLSPQVKNGLVCPKYKFWNEMDTLLHSNNKQIT